MIKTLTVLLLASAPLAHAQNKLSDHNNWNDDEISFSADATLAPMTIGKSSAIPTASFHYAMTHDYFSKNDRVELNVGYTPIEYFRLRYEFTIGQGAETGDNDKSTYIILPFLGDLRMRPGLNQLGHNWSENSSTSASWGGIGVRRGGLLNHSGTSNFRANAAVKWVQVSEMLAPGQYTNEGMAVTGREASNVIQANGPGIEGSAQVVIMNKVLLGIGGEGSWISESGKDVEGDAVTIRYTNYEGKVYAQMRLKRGRGFTVDVLANYYMRVTNLTDTRATRTITIPSLGLRLNLGR